jgi:hypothetical protein
LCLDISESTFTEWCRIDDNEELFLTVKRPGGRPEKTTTRDDRSLRELALENNWDNFDQLRHQEEFQQNRRLMSVTDATLRSRLRDAG